MQLPVILALYSLGATHQIVAIMTPSLAARRRGADSKEVTPADGRKDEYPGPYLHSQLCEFAVTPYLAALHFESPKAWLCKLGSNT